ncbi:hypothetical protein [Paraburkholderia saeva]|uniref:Uncharacterized protein n=1 Tax=Paraburkholderia saeva TaxID=2777537 RepID=A0A9N8X464_9BURK|nr:hypothetical protein [Paraburkholderia saeva]CAG4891365.1 hypothetical protein R70241_01105 [Paraburkholderia saeva]CAG4921642.1 hypothetical protein LMG31841_05112 [Paraburkholderia saeva]CAG4928455.1 hypothetical protein R52603_05702 [Paraburkholderia saeva]
MSNQAREKHPHGNKSEKHIDKAVEDTFPASDPPSIGGTTKIAPKDRDAEKHASTEKRPHHKH